MKRSPAPTLNTVGAGIAQKKMRPLDRVLASKRDSSVPSTVIAAPPVDLEATLDGGQAFRWWPDGAGWRGVIGRRAVRLTEAESGILIEAVDGRPIEDLPYTVSRYLSLDVDLARLQSRFADDPCLGPALRGYTGLRLLRQDPWECLSSFICSSISNIPRIKLNIGSVACDLGERVGPGDRDFAFPSAATVAEAGEKRLRRLGLGFRGKFLAQAAATVADGGVDLDALKLASYADARAALTSLNGVGEKVADCTLAFSLDKPEAFPIDRWIRRALEEWYGLPPGLNNSKAADWARAEFGEYGAIAQQYIFHRERLAGRAKAWGGRHVMRVLPEDAARMPDRAS